MPRLRYLKNYERIHAEYEQADEHIEEEARTGQSWLSNSSIISSMPDSKLREAINLYRNLAMQMEQELLFRSKMAKQTSISAELRTAYKIDRVELYISNKRRQATRNKRQRAIFKGLKLSPQLKRSLLECLQQIANQSES